MMRETEEIFLDMWSESLRMKNVKGVEVRDVRSKERRPTVAADDAHTNI